MGMEEKDLIKRERETEKEREINKNLNRKIGLKHLLVKKM